MSIQASLNKSLEIGDLHSEEFFENIYNDLNELLDSEDSGPGYPRAELDFGSSPVFVQTSDYNVFIGEDGLTFHGLEHGSSYFSSEESTSGEVLSYLSDIYDVEDWEKELSWY